MDGELLNGLRQFLERERDLCADGERWEEKGKEKLAAILSDKRGNGEALREIRDFEKAGEAQRGKLYGYCLSLSQSFAEDSSGYCEVKELGFIQTENHKFLTEDEIDKLVKFVKEHKSDKTFGEIVFSIMDEHGMTPPQVYKNAMLRRQDFSRVTSPKCTGVKKTTVWSIIIGLHCDPDEAQLLLESAGKAGYKTEADLIIEYMIRRKNYDVMAINAVLEHEHQPALACYRSVKDGDPF